MTTHTLRPYQRRLDEQIVAAWSAGARNVGAVLPTGGGKCLARGTPVLMADGSIKPVEDVVVGDRLASPTGDSRCVIALGRGREMMYRVTPTKGDPYVVNASHILSLQSTQFQGTVRLADGQRVRGGQRVAIPAADFFRSSATAKHVLKGWRAPVKHFVGEYAFRPIPPYVLALWLGDGTALKPALTKLECPVVDAWCAWGELLGLDVKRETSNGTRCPTWSLVRRKGTAQANPMSVMLKTIGVLGNRHIPHSYKTATLSERRDLVAGLLDTDGSVARTGYDWISVDSALARDFVFVARSVGLSAYLTECEKGIKSTGFAGKYFRVSLTGDFSKIPCRQKVAPPRQQVKRHDVHGIAVEPIGVDDYFGFEIDGDRLFMLGDFTVTHNTVVFAHRIAQERGAVVAIAHRQELVSQMSLALAREGVRHRVIAPANVGRTCASIHLAELGTSLYDPGARVAVAGVDTLVNRRKDDPFFAQVSLWVLDETHHLLAENKWGDAVSMMPNARGLGVTATPVRSDGRGLGRHADGLIDVLVEGPGMRELIGAGYLTDYRIFAPPSDLDLSAVTVTATGDFSPKPLKEARRRSHITGDVVQHYLRIARGKLGVTFDTDVESATETAAAYRTAGVPAEVVSAKTPDALRAQILRRFRAREILQLVNVDLFGEGFDLPAIEVVSMARPTQSFGLYCQQFGRSLRPLDGKAHAIIIDHVGNVMRHGLPDAPRVWSLDRRERRSRATPDDVIPVRTCLEPTCMSVYERALPACPYCGHVPTPAARSAPEYVDGDLGEIDPAVLARMRGEAAQVRGDWFPTPRGAAPEVVGRLRKVHHAKQQAQARLEDVVTLWAGWQQHLGRGDAETYRRFFLTYGVDVGTAMALPAQEADSLAGRVAADLARHNVVRKEAA